MINEAIQKKLLEKILNSKEFSTSKIYKAYLSYLVEATNKGIALKETTIAIDVFGKDANFNPAEDTIVRSHAYALRKKLENYYYNEGREDGFHLQIPKGHYEARFVPASEDYADQTKKIFRKYNKYFHFTSIVIIFLIILLTLLWIWNLSLERKLTHYQFIERTDPIWKEYLKPVLPVMIVLGDHFFFTEYSDKYQSNIVIRQGKINSVEDLETYYPNKNLKPSDEPYFPYHSIWSLPPILNIFYSVNQKPILRRSLQLNTQILDEYNIIYLGSIKTLGILKHTLAKSHFSFEILPHKIYYTPPDSGKVQTFETALHSAGLNEDLVLALKLPGPANNSIFIIASYHSLGAPEIAHYLTNPKSMAELKNKFMQKYQHVPPYFEILFRVTGIDKTAYHNEILIFNEISK
jgi:hypothetical protein